MYYKNYSIYKNSRNASWKFLIQHNIRTLPLDLKKIISDMDIVVFRDNTGILKSDEKGKTVYAKGRLTIIVRRDSAEDVRYTIAHEIGHIVLGHLEKEILSEKDEYAAERFAIGILAPACVLWGIGVETAEEIKMFCNISEKSAKKREKRMKELYRRNKFLTSPLEKEVFEQFGTFIQANRLHNL